MKAAPSPQPAPRFVKMSALAAQSGVPAATIKHYVREGLVNEAAIQRTGRNMAYYDPGLAPRIRAIKELQQTRFLPLKVIRDIIDTPERDDASEAAVAIARTLERMSATTSLPGKRRSEIIASGVPAKELAFFESLGLIAPEGEGGEARYVGEDLAFLQLLKRARTAGITKEMLPHTILSRYVDAIATLVRVELEMFHAGVIPQAGADVGKLTEVATELSERLIVLLRRKMLVPMLAEVRDQGAPAPKPTSSHRRVRPSSSKKRGKTR